MSISFSEELVSAFSMVFFIAVKRLIVKSGILIALGVSEAFKGVLGVTEESELSHYLS